ncbi:NAD(P)-dependent oxidoreductase, partial [Dehalococcoidia bacterium]|nr:NAD(P)-dependent oxidoreductase [Dehalococcoidia bacterium]
YDLDLIGLRYTLVYGYGKMETVVRGSGVTHLTEIIDKPALDQGPSVVPRGDDDGDWLYVEDVARAVVAADSIVRPKTKAFNIVGDMRSTREVSDYVSALLPDADIRLESGGSGRSWNYDGSAARDEIGYVPQFKIEEGIKRNINDLRGRAGLPLVGQERF